ncbi:T9SS type A sorting domain-containing protein [Flavobacterium cerinum]|uniref:T9SS type A sorting domain-containing protein n=1 Tax=Flavobacterium cerinum TaxID=2502784 RepID=A0ABY5IVU5_9FLAO|nr:T9SS type A sorting domain-containing protein [Flavobacterium cerinum]UUC45873.1 T9SS type A sorting domain-containing protein [Flavobacterium cerinum]
MKKTIFDVKAGVLMCCLFLIAAFSSNAQTLTLGTTNALGMTSTSSGGTYTYNVTVPYFANDLTGTFNVTVPYSCQANYTKKLYLSNAFGSVNSSTGSNIITIPGPLLVGINSYTVTGYCEDGSSQPDPVITTFNIKVVVTRETAPSVSLSFSPYCKITPNSNPQLYSGYIGFNVTGNYVNAGKLYLRVTNALGTCPYADYKVTFLNNTGAATATINPTASFYDCASTTTYTIKLVYKTTSMSGTPITYIVSSGSIGWTDYSWTKTFKNCLNKLDPQPQDPVLVGRIANEDMADLAETKKFNVYPNPTNSDLNILPVEGKEIRSAKVIDPSGFVYESKAFGSAKGLQTVSLAHLRPGIYFVEIETNEGVFVEKVVKN